MNQEKDFSICPVCGKPRGKRGYEFAHGDCMEYRARTEGKTLSNPNKKGFEHLTVDHVRQSKYNARKKRYSEGKLPSFMYD